MADPNGGQFFVLRREVNIIINSLRMIMKKRSFQFEKSDVINI